MYIFYSSSLSSVSDWLKASGDKYDPKGTGIQSLSLDDLSLSMDTKSGTLSLAGVVIENLCPSYGELQFMF